MNSTDEGKKSPHERLSLEEKESIRDYMLKIFTIPALIVPPVSFVLGFFLNEVATQKGIMAGFEKANQIILQTTQDVSEAKGRVNSALQQAQESISRGQTEIDRATSTARSAVASANEVTQRSAALLSGKTDEMVRAILATPEFSNSANRAIEQLIASTGSNIATVSRTLSALRLDCKTEMIRAAPSNNFTISIPTPAGYSLVGGSCAFDNWQAGDQPTLIQVGPNNASGQRWSCYAKQPRADTFTATATFCRINSE